MRLDQKALEVFQAFRSWVRRVRLDRYGLVLRALPALLVLRALLAILVRRACLELMVQTAKMARQDRAAILVQMGTMARTATKVLQALKDLRVTKATRATMVQTA